MKRCCRCHWLATWSEGSKCIVREGWYKSAQVPSDLQTFWPREQWQLLAYKMTDAFQYFAVFTFRLTTNRKLHCVSSDCVMWRLVIDCLTVSNRRTSGCFQHVYIDISSKKTMFRLWVGTDRDQSRSPKERLTLWHRLRNLPTRFLSNTWWQFCPMRISWIEVLLITEASGYRAYYCWHRREGWECFQGFKAWGLNVSRLAYRVDYTDRL